MLTLGFLTLITPNQVSISQYNWLYNQHFITDDSQTMDCNDVSDAGNIQDANMIDDLTFSEVYIYV